MELQKIFFSSKNTTHIIEFVVTKLFDEYDLQTQNFIRKNANKYKQIVVEIQHYIWSTTNLPPQTHNSSKEFLGQLNQLSIQQLEHFIKKDITKYFAGTQPRELQVQATQPQATQPQATQPQQLETNTQQQPQDDTKVHIEHLFSVNATNLVEGRYKFQIPLLSGKIIKSIYFESIEIECNLYNINHTNNKFEIIESDSRKFQVNIPFGYYDIYQLMECITEICNKHSPNNATYKVYLHPLKHKTYFTCASPFKIVFPHSSTAFPISDMLGFSEKEYTCESTCVSEHHPNTRIFDTLFLKLFVNEKEIPQVYSGENDSYFKMLQIPYSDHYGAKHFWMDKEPFPSVFDFEETIKFENIGIEICNPISYKLDQIVTFNFVCVIEYE